MLPRSIPSTRAMLYSQIVLCVLATSTLAWKTLNVPHTPGEDDTPALVAALPKFTTNATIVFSKGIHYNIFTPIRFPVLTNVDIRIEGNLSYPTDIPTIQGRHWYESPRRVRMY